MTQQQSPAGNSIKTLQKKALTLKNREIINAQEGIEKEDLLYLAQSGGEKSPGLPRQMSRHCQRELSLVMIK